MSFGGSGFTAGDPTKMSGSTFDINTDKLIASGTIELSGTKGKLDLTNGNIIASGSYYSDGVQLGNSFLGVGTSMPAYDQDAIHLKSTSGFPNITVESVGAAKNPIFQLKTNTTADMVEMYIDNDGTDNPFYIRRGGTAPPSLAIFDDNNIRLGGTGSPSVQVSGTLDVSGTLKATNGIDPVGSAADSIQIGSNNGAVAIGSLNISFGGTVLGQGSQAIGPGSPQAIAAGASAIGSGSNAIAANAMALGTLASASATSAVAVGTSATGSAANAIAVGTSTQATAAGATALGNAATSSAAGAIAIGSGATTAGAYSVVLGDTITNVIHNHTTVIGSRAAVGGANAVAIGSGSNASAANAIAIGQSAAPSAADTVAIGQAAAPSASGSVAIGAGSTTTGQQSVVLGPTNTTTANYTTVVGYNNNASVNYSIIIGDTSVASAANAVAVGQKVLASGADSIAIGQFATASAANTIAIGSGSVANEANTVVFGNATQPVRLFVSGAMASTYFSASIGAATNASCSFYNIFNYDLTNTLTLTALNPIAGASYLFFFRQDGTGSRVITFSGFKWPGGTVPTLSTAAGSVDIVSGISDGTYIYADTTKNFS